MTDVRVIKGDTILDKTVTIDITPILNCFNKIYPERDVEIDFVRNFNYLQLGTVVKEFTLSLMDIIFQNTESRKFTDIYKFYREKDYTNRINNFISNMEYEVSKHIGTSYNNYRVTNVVDYIPNEKLIVELSYG